MHTADVIRILLLHLVARNILWRHFRSFDILLQELFKKRKQINADHHILGREFLLFDDLRSRDTECDMTCILQELWQVRLAEVSHC